MMLKLFLALLFTFTSTFSYAQFNNGGVFNKGLMVSETDDSPRFSAKEVIFPNGSLTDNQDGTASINFTTTDDASFNNLNLTGNLTGTSATFSGDVTVGTLNYSTLNPAVDLTDYVPYTGAAQEVDLGSQFLVSQGNTIDYQVSGSPEIVVDIAGSTTGYSAENSYSQGFKTSSSGEITSFEMALSTTAGSTGTITGYIYSDNGAGKPDSILATFSSVDISTIGTSFADYEFTGTYNATAGVQYHATVVRSGATGTLSCAYTAGNPYAYGFTNYGGPPTWSSIGSFDARLVVYQTTSFGIPTLYFQSSGNEKASIYADGNNSYALTVEVGGAVDLVADGSSFDFQDNDITTTGDISQVADNATITQGAGNDFSQYFDGTDQKFSLTSGYFIFNSGLIIDQGGLVNSVLNINGSTDSYLRSTATDLFQIGHGGSDRLTIDGSGHLHIPSDSQKLYQGDSDDYSQYFDGTNQNFELTSGAFVFDTTIGTTTLTGREVNMDGGIGYVRGSSDLRIQSQNGGSGSGQIYLTNNAGGGGYVLLKGVGGVKLQADNQKLYFGAGDDYSIDYDGTDLNITKNTAGTVQFNGCQVWIPDSSLFVKAYVYFDGYNAYVGRYGFYGRSAGSPLIISNQASEGINLVGGNIKLPADNQKLYFGAGDDTSITYDGTDLNIKADEVGTGAVAVQSDMLFDGSGTGLPYGQIHVKENTTTTTISASGVANKVQFTEFDANGVSNLTTPDHTNDHITLSKAGVYLVTCTASIDSVDPTGSEFAFEVWKNNGTTQVDNLHANIHVNGGSGEKKSVALSGIVSLSASDTLELWVYNTTGTEDILLEDVTLLVTQIGG